MLRQSHRYTWMVVLATGLSSPSAAQPRAAPDSGRGMLRPRQVRVEEVTAREVADGVDVSIRASGPFGPASVGATSSGPPRVYVDIRDAAPGASASIPLQTGLLKRARVAVHSTVPLVTRIVFDLSSAATHELMRSSDSNELTIHLAWSARAGLGGTTVGDQRRGATTATMATTTSTTAATANAAVTPIGAAAPSAPASGTSRTAQQAPATGGWGASSPARPWGRMSVYVNASRQSSERSTFSTGEVVTSVAYQLPEREDDGLEYGVDVRHAQSTVDGRPRRVSIYDGYVGARVANGRLRARGGYMWLNDLGALGSLAGGLVEVRQPSDRSTTAGRYRVGAFAGLEPNLYNVGYAENVTKFGGYVALDAARSRRHVLGYVAVRNGGLVERSVVTVANYLPVGARFFLYQAAELDTSGPAGRGHRGVGYLFANARYTASSRVELQGTYNRGRSVDARSISEDVLSGRAVSQRAVEGLLYESVGGRVTIEVVPRVRVYAGYSRDRNNRDDLATGRWLVGGFAANLANSGLDLAFSNARTDRPTGSFQSRYVSLGRQLGRRVYLSGDYTTSLSFVRFQRGDGLIVETRPQTTRIGFSSVMTINRPLSLLLTVERTIDEETADVRLLSGFTYRLP